MTQLMQDSVQGEKNTNRNLPQSRMHVSNLTLLRKFIPIIIPISSILYASTAFAVQAPTPQPKPGFAEAFKPLISLLQDAAFPIGIGIAIWGMIEWMMDNPKGKERVKQALVCYVAIFVIPYLFTVIRDAFRGMMP